MSKIEKINSEITLTWEQQRRADIAASDIIRGFNGVLGYKSGANMGAVLSRIETTIAKQKEAGNTDKTLRYLDFREGNRDEWLEQLEALEDDRDTKEKQTLIVVGLEDNLDLARDTEISKKLSNALEFRNSLILVKRSGDLQEDTNTVVQLMNTSRMLDDRLAPTLHEIG